MGGCGADPLPRDLTGLTPRHRAVYARAVALNREGRRVTFSLLARDLGMTVNQVKWSRRKIQEVVGWPIPLANRASGTHGLTPVQRQILTMSCELWEGGEYPALGLLGSLLDPPCCEDSIVRTRKECVRLGIWPCRVRKGPVPLGPAEIEFLMSYRGSGRSMGLRYATLIGEFCVRFGRRISGHAVYRVFRRRGVTRRISVSPSDAASRKAEVIAEREGFAPAKLQEPAAFARACRLARAGKVSSSRRVSP